ncbi:MAG: DUF1269 domain-containing protein [Acidimicrobiales bacterium]
MELDKDKPYDFAVVVYEGKDTADRAVDTLKELEKEGKLKIHDAAVITRTDKGKIKLDNKGFIGGGKGGAIGLVIGAVLGGPIVGAVVGWAVGFFRSNDRREIRDVLTDKLGLTESALATVVEDADWDAILPATEHLGGEAVHYQLQGESLAKLEQMAAEDPDIEAAAAEEMEIT